MVEGYTKVDMVGDLDRRKNKYDYLFTFVGGFISWKLKLQNVLYFQK